MVSFEPKEKRQKKLHDLVITCIENHYRNSEFHGCFEHTSTKRFEINNDGTFLFIFNGDLNGIDKIIDVLGRYDRITYEVISIDTILVNDEIFSNN